MTVQRGQEEKTILLASSNWNDTSKTGLSNLNSNNVTANNNRNISAHAELRQHQRLNSFLIPTKTVKQITLGTMMLVPTLGTLHLIPLKTI